MATPVSPRQVALSQRGTILRSVDLIMGAVQVLHPRRIFPPQRPGGGERYAQVDAPWQRAGTSPGGASMIVAPDGTGMVSSAAAVPGWVSATGTWASADGVAPFLGKTPAANYFVGWPEKQVEQSLPQRAVWLLPGEGEEQFGPPQAVGPLIDQRPPGYWQDPVTGLAHPTGRTDDGNTGVGGGGAGGGEYGGRPGPHLPSATDGSQGGRVLHPWSPAELVPAGEVAASDGVAAGGTNGLRVPTGTDGQARRELIAPQYGGGGHALGGGWAATLVRTRAIPMRVHLWGSDLDDTEELAHWVMTAVESTMTLVNGQSPLRSGGFLRDEKGDRGLVYVLNCLFSAGVIMPPAQQQPVLSFGTRVLI